MWSIIIGLLVVVLGFFMAYKPRFFVEFIGHQAWVEKIFAVADDELAYKLIGIIIIFIGGLIMTGLITNVLYFLLGPVLGAGRL